MATLNILLVFLIPLSLVEGTLPGDDHDEHCVETVGSEKLLVQKKLAKISATMQVDGSASLSECDKFLETSDPAKKDKHKLLKAATVSAVRTTIKVVAAAAGPVGGFATSMGAQLLFGAVADRIMPDPNQLRMKNLESGMNCLSSAIDALQEDVEKLQQQHKNLQEELKDVSYLVGYNTGIELKELSATLKDLAEDHWECERLMKCAADLRYMNKQDDFSLCEPMLEKFKIHRTKEDCGAEAFQDKLVNHNDYDVVKRDLDHLAKYIKQIIKKNMHYMYPVAYSILAEYSAVATDFYLAWSSVEGWAAAICHPFGNGTVSCNQKAQKLVKLGLGEFKKYTTGFQDELDKFIDSLKEAHFMKTRQDSFIIVRHLSDSLCHVTKVAELSHKEEVSAKNCEHMRGVGRVCSEINFGYWFMDKLDLNCSEDAMKQKYCKAANPCRFTPLLPGKPFGCQPRDCDGDWWKAGCIACTWCRQRHEDAHEQKWCPPCGMVKCSYEGQFQVHYDHLAEHMEYLENISHVLSERKIIGLPLRLPAGGTYYLSPFFCHKFGKDKRFRKNCGAPTPAPPTPAPPTPVPPTPMQSEAPTLAPAPAFQNSNLLLVSKTNYQLCTLYGATSEGAVVVVREHVNPLGASGQWSWNPTDFTIKFGGNSALCINTEDKRVGEGKRLLLYPCHPVTASMQWEPSSDGTIHFKSDHSVGFNVYKGNRENHHVQTWRLSGEGNEIFEMGSLPPSRDGLIRIRARPTYCLNVRGANYKNFASLVAFSCSPLEANMQFKYDSRDQTIRPEAAPTQCLDINHDAAIVLHACHGSDSQKFVFKLDGSIRLVVNDNGAFNIAGGLSGDINNKKLIIYKVSSPLEDNMIFDVSTSNPTALAVIVKKNYLCGNRGSLRGDGCCSKAAVTSLQSCANFVATNPSCGTEFSWSSKEEYCDCVPAGEGPCSFYPDEKYNIYTFSPYFYMKWKNALCFNRGGVGGNNVYSSKQLTLQACAAHVAAVPFCGQEFSYGGYGGKEHWCDCVPSGKGPCAWYSDATTEQENYSVYTLAI